MTNEIASYNLNEEGVVIYQTDDNTLQLDVQVAEETVWLTQQQMASLFNSTIPNVSMHIRNIYKEGELEKGATVKDFLIVQNEGGRQVTRHVSYYNLDVIISVGYRVKSQAGTRFRQWANKVIKDYMLKGYAVNQRVLAMEERVDNRLATHERRLEAVEQKIDFFVRTNMPPVEQVFYNGEFFAARVLLEKLIKTAARRVIIIDAYVDAATFEMLDVRAKGVKADIYSGKDLSNMQKLHNTSSGLEPIDTHIWKNASHDRWLIIDDTVYHCGHSLKDMGQKLCAISQLGVDADDILKKIR